MYLHVFEVLFVNVKGLNWKFYETAAPSECHTMGMQKRIARKLMAVPFWNLPHFPIPQWSSKVEKHERFTFYNQFYESGSLRTTRQSRVASVCDASLDGDKLCSWSRQWVTLHSGSLMFRKMGQWFELENRREKKINSTTWIFIQLQMPQSIKISNENME